MTGTALRVDGLRVETDSGDVIVDGVDLTLRSGEILGLVGESGSGKTTTALSILGWTAPGARRTAGNIRDNAGLHSRVTYVPQNPGSALSPSLRIIDALTDMLRSNAGEGSTPELITGLLADVGLPSTREFQRRYRHQLSGGQQQRVCVALALAGDPAVLVLDEPTTGLDVFTQAKVLETLLTLRDEHGLAMVYVTHDLSVVAQIADRVAVMYAGRVVEEGTVRDVLRSPRHPYTRGLIASIPDHLQPRRLEAMNGIAVGIGERPDGCAFHPRCELRGDRCSTERPELEPIDDGREVSCFEVARTSGPTRAPVVLRAVAPRLGHSAVVLEVGDLRAEHRSRGNVVVAARNVSFAVETGSCVALVGESGSGKTTIGRAIVGLHRRSGGSVRLLGDELAPMARKRTTRQRAQVQMVFQNPSDALNPRHTVRATVGRPAEILRGLRGEAIDTEVMRLLDAVRLPARVANRYPRELSGGERQRVAIARALAADPIMLVCDEVTSSLDVSVQAAVVRLLEDLRDEFGLSLLFITHDLGVVATIADQVLVLDGGELCERGTTTEVLTAPTHPYTQRLLSAAPSLSAVLAAWDACRESPDGSPSNPPSSASLNGGLECKTTSVGSPSVGMDN